MFPRSVMEIEEELEDSRLSQGLTIDNNLIVSYASPIFFFVGSDNHQLAGRIAQGLLILFETGRFQTLLTQQEGYKQGMSLISGRRIIDIQNPLLSEQSKLALERFLPEFELSVETALYIEEESDQ
jgi:hypothetical protein